MNRPLNIVTATLILAQVYIVVISNSGAQILGKEATIENGMINSTSKKCLDRVVGGFDCFDYVINVPNPNQKSVGNISNNNGSNALLLIVDVYNNTRFNSTRQLVVGDTFELAGALVNNSPNTILLYNYGCGFVFPKFDEKIEKITSKTDACRDVDGQPQVDLRQLNPEDSVYLGHEDHYAVIYKANQSGIENAELVIKYFIFSPENHRWDLVNGIVPFQFSISK